MKMSNELRCRIVSAVEEKKAGRAADVARAMKVSEATLSCIFSGHVKTISDETSHRISRYLNIPLPEMMVLSMGGVPDQVCEESAAYVDIYDRLAKWMRSAASDDGKKSILMMAQALGFRDQGLIGALNALCETAISRAG